MDGRRGGRGGAWVGVTHSDGVTNDFERRIRLLPRWNMLTEERKEDCLLENRTPMHPSILTIRSHPMSDVLVLVATAVPTSSPSRGGDVAVYVFDINLLILPIPFHYVLVSVFMALSTVFHSINSPNNSPLSHSVLPILFLPHWSFQLDIYL